MGCGCEGAPFHARGFLNKLGTSEGIPPAQEHETANNTDMWVVS